MPETPEATETAHAHCTTVEAARRLGMAVRSVQLMVDRGELTAWRTPGGHRRISNASIEHWIAQRGGGASGDAADATGHAAAPAPSRVLLIEDSVHYQNLISLLIKQKFPEVQLHIASDGLAGLIQYGRLQPDVLIIDILLPGIDGAALITSLRSQDQFDACRLIVVTSLDEAQREPYAFALADLPVVHKPRLVADLPRLLERCLAQASALA